MSELRFQTLRRLLSFDEYEKPESIDSVEYRHDDALSSCVECRSSKDAGLLLLETSSEAPSMSDFDYTPFPMPFLLDSSPPYDVVINGYLMPFLAVFTLITNTLVVTVLLRRHMRTPTNALLVALATSDTLTSVSPVPVWVRFYTISSRPDADWVPYDWCFVYYLSMDYLPSMFHTASVWLTLAISGQRYLRVCRPPDSLARRLVCSTKGARRIAICVFVVAIATHLVRLGEMTYSPIELPSRAVKLDIDDDGVHSIDSNSSVALMSTASVSDPSSSSEFEQRQLYVTGCRVELSRFVEMHEDAYFSVYYWTRVIFVHLVPCASLIAFNFCLVRTLLEASRRRRIWRSREPTSRQPSTAYPNSSPSMLALTVQRTPVCDNSGAPKPPTTLAVPRLTEIAIGPNVPSTGSATEAAALAPSNSQRLRVAGHAGHGPSSTRATVMLMIVVGVSLVVEIPLMVIFVMVIIENAAGVDLYEDATRHTAELFVNLFITISYPLNFFVYCSMSHEFRRTFSAMFTRQQ